jgi:hypothetical protein
MTEPAVVAIAFFPLSRAMICVQDETIFDREYSACPTCASPHVIPLARWLGSVNGAPVYDRVYDSIESWAAARRSRT